MNIPRRRWFQLSLKSLFLLTLLVATFFAGYSLATKRAEEAVRAEQEARKSTEDAARRAEVEAKRLQQLVDRDVIDLSMVKVLSGEAGDPSILTVK